MRIFVMSALLVTLLVSSHCLGQDEKENASTSGAKQDWTRSKVFAVRAETPPTKGKAHEATLAALDWLVRHQHEKGYWSSWRVQSCCADAKNPCESQGDPFVVKFRGVEGYDVGVTGLAMLAFMARGNTHLQAEKPEYREAMRKALGWILEQTTSHPTYKGALGYPGSPSSTDAEVEPVSWIYNHCVASLALAELLVGTGDQEKLRKQVETSVACLLDWQSEGWQYGRKTGSNTSVSIWASCVLATARHCHEAKLLKLDAPAITESLQKVRRWLDKVTTEAKYRPGMGIGYTLPLDPGSQLTNLPVTFREMWSTPTNTAAALFFESFEDGKPSKRRKPYWRTLSECTPKWKPYVSEPETATTINFNYWYYGGLASYQKGGSLWTKWRKRQERALLPHQRDSGCEAGSWDPIGMWGDAAGRAGITAFGALTLSTELRFERIK